MNDKKVLNTSIFNPAYSVYADCHKFQKDKHINNRSGEFKENNNVNMLINDIYPKFNKKWIDESLILRCQSYDCNYEFGYLSQRHHCRACGHVFCTTCCDKFIKIPDFIKRPEESNTYKQQLVNLCKYSYCGEQSRVCKECYNKINNLQNIITYTHAAECFDLKTLHKMMRVNKQWYNACIHQLSRFREIQYKLDSCLYDNWEINMLRSADNILMSHSNWVIHLIKGSLQLYYENSDENILKSINVRNTVKKYNCWSLMCSRKCLLELDLLNYIEILKFVSILENKKKILWENKYVREFLLKILHDICQISNHNNKIILKSCMPLLCSVIIELLDDEIYDIDIDFVNHILDELIIYPESWHIMYDELEYLRSLNKCSNGVMGIANFHDILQNYLSNNVELKHNIMKMKSNIIKIINSVSNDEQHEIITPFLYPLDYNWNIVRINKCTVMDSNSKPVLLDVKIVNSKKESKNVKILIKKELTLRKEQLVSSLIYILLFRLKQHEFKKKEKFESIPTYQIKMLTSDVGIIEVVKDSITLREINDQGYTMQNRILNKNKNDKLDDIKYRFMTSLAISCCISYLLGLGDRHLDNIMINDKGQIFNIDYGYLLEHPMTNILGAPNIKVTHDMIDFLGGPKSEYYEKFKKYLASVYDIMRLYKNIIVSHYELIASEDLLDWNIFKDKLESRFLTGLDNEEFQIILIKEIESSSSVSSSFNDACHQLKMWWSKS